MLSEEMRRPSAAGAACPIYELCETGCRRQPRAGHVVFRRACHVFPYSFRTEKLIYRKLLTSLALPAGFEPALQH
jgi:hypothetical protein